MDVDKHNRKMVFERQQSANLSKDENLASLYAKLGKLVDAIVAYVEKETKNK